MRIYRLPALLVTAPLLIGCASLPASDASSAPHPAAAAAPAQPPTPAPANAPIADLALQKLKAQLEDDVARQQGTYGVFVIDITSGKGVGVNYNVPFPAASTIKLPMAMYILSLVDRGQLSLDERIAYLPEVDYQAGTGALHGSIRRGQRIPVRRLLELAIIYSDNIAANMLSRRVGPGSVFDFMSALGGTLTEYAENAPRTTPRDMAHYMRLAASDKVVADPQLRQFLLDLLSNTAFTGRTAAGAPKGVKVAHKIGSLPGVVNDVALIYAPNRPFVIAVFSMDVKEAVAANVIARITRQVYVVHRSLGAPQ